MKAQAAVVLVALGVLAGCADPEDTSGAEANRAVAQANEDNGEAGMTGTDRHSGNPAERPDVEVYRPTKLANVRYDAANNMVTDLDTGDRLSVSHGHAGGVGQYGVSNEKTGLIAYGGYRNWAGGNSRVLGFEILSLQTEHATGAPFRSRSEFNTARMAELFKAYRDASIPDHHYSIIVVDARPETMNDSNTVNEDTKENEQ